jgi:DNA modification methylase
MIPTDTENYTLMAGDCIRAMQSCTESSIDMCMYSPPFPSVYAYNSDPADVGNSEDYPEIKIHFSYLFRGILRLMKPGRVMVVHCNQVVRYKRGGGDGGLFDFRGFLLRLAQRAGWIYSYDWMVRRNPQAQAIKTRSRELQFSGLESDRARSRGTLCDYLLVLTAPGENSVPIDSQGQVSRNEWIEWAEGCWTGIKETRTLNTAEAKSPEDTKHICAMQLDLIERCVKLYSNPGEIVFDPFTGIGSTGYVALKLGRRFRGCELKPEYHAAALKNLGRAVNARSESTRTLFDALAD